jgi:hypothetical protein
MYETKHINSLTYKTNTIKFVPVTLDLKYPARVAITTKINILVKTNKLLFKMIY